MSDVVSEKDFFDEFELDLKRFILAHQEFLNEIENLLKIRQDLIDECEVVIKDLHEHHKNVNISKAVGSSVGIAGGVLSITGIVLTPVTFGGSLALTIIGSGMAAAGGFTTAGAQVTEFGISKFKLSSVEKAICNDQEQFKKTVEKYQELKNISQKIQDKIEINEKERAQQRFDSRYWIWKKMRVLWNKFSSLTCSETSWPVFLWNIVSAGKSAARFVSACFDAIQVIAIGLEEFGSKSGLVAKIATKLIGATAFKILDRTFLGIGMFLDVITLISTLYDIYNGSKSRAALQLQEQVETLKDEKKQWEVLVKVVDDMRSITSA